MYISVGLVFVVSKHELNIAECEGGLEANKLPK